MNRREIFQMANLRAVMSRNIVLTDQIIVKKQANSIPSFTQSKYCLKSVIVDITVNMNINRIVKSVKSRVVLKTLSSPQETLIYEIYDKHVEKYLKKSCKKRKWDDDYSSEDMDVIYVPRNSQKKMKFYLEEAASLARQFT